MPDKIKNRYVLKRLIGQGGMADVYLAWDEILGREVAIKILRDNLARDPQTLVRFLREASAARKLKHPNVVEIYDIGESDNLHYLVMEYVPGMTLKELITQTGPMDARRAVGYMKELTSAIVDAHAHQLIHRDIKPQNVLIAKDGTLKLSDFGIAVSVDGKHIQKPEAVMGSSHYLAPESAAGKAPDYRVDVYALGIVFFELLCGSVPFTGTTPASIALKHMKDPLPPIAPYNDTVSQGIENIVIKATAKNPDERYQSASELLDALDHAFDRKMKNAKPLVLETQSLDLPQKGHESEQEVEIRPHLKPLSHIEKPGKYSMRIVSLSAILAILACGLVAFSMMSLGVLPVSGWFGWVKVPDVSGMSEQVAITTLEEAGLEPDQIQIEQIASDGIDPGYVASTSIEAGRFIKSGSPLVVRVSKGPTFLITDYTGQYLDDVQNLFAQNHVLLKIDVTYQGSANTNPGIILEQSGMDPGVRIDPDSTDTIRFTVSTYPSLTIEPSFIGMDVNELKEYLNAQGIAVDLRAESGGSTVTAIDPPVGSTYTQEGSDSVVTLYH